MQLCSKIPDSSSEFKDDRFINFGGVSAEFPDEDQKVLYQVKEISLSYLFVGDFDDRYWNGYLLAHLPKRSDKWLDGCGATPTTLSWLLPDLQHVQRSILEPYYVEKMLGEINFNVNIILKKVDDWLKDRVFNQLQISQGT